MQRKRIILAIVAIAILLAALLCYFLSHRSTPLAYSGTIETREINIGSKTGGRVTAVFVEEGQQVPANAPLVNFDAPELQAQRNQAQATVLQNRADYDRLQRGNRPQEIAEADATLHENAALLQEALNGPRPQDIRQAQADYAAAKANAVDAAATYDRMKPLVEKDVISKQQFDSYTAQRNNTAQLADLQKLPDANPPNTSRLELEAPAISVLLAQLRQFPGVREATIFGRAIHALVDTNAIDALHTAFPQLSLRTIQPSLEDIFVTLTYHIMAEQK